MSSSVLPMFSSKGFIVSGITFRSLIYFEFNFVYGARKCYNCIFLHVALQFCQHHLLKRVSFLHCVLFVKDKLTVSVWVYFCTCFPVPLIYMSLFAPVHTVLMTVTLQYSLKSGSMILLAPFFFLKIVFGFSESFVFPYKL